MSTPSATAATPVLQLEAGTGAPSSSVASAPLAVKQAQKTIDHSGDDAARSTHAIVDYVEAADSEAYKARLAEGKSRMP